MAKLYYRRIKEKKINPETGELWMIGDVPERWRAAVQTLLGNDES